MTKVWGPMGWMTLHSISVAYPDTPTESDRRIVNEFMNAFATSITCVYCRDHFNKMFSDYKSKVPSWANSKRDLFLAICRMHNAVNKRLDKPQTTSVAESIEWLKRATSYTTQSQFRENYANYLIRDWSYQRQSGDGHAGYLSSITIKKINDEYWTPREVQYSNISFEEDNVSHYSEGYTSQKAVIPKFNLNALLGRRR